MILKGQLSLTRTLHFNSKCPMIDKKIQKAKIL